LACNGQTIFYRWEAKVTAKNDSQYLELAEDIMLYR